MEEKKITEQESLELIARMIASTKENLEVGSGNQFLYWGYFSVFLSVAVFACVHGFGFDVLYLYGLFVGVFAALWWCKHDAYDAFCVIIHGHRRVDDRCNYS